MPGLTYGTLSVPSIVPNILRTNAAQVGREPGRATYGHARSRIATDWKQNRLSVRNARRATIAG